MRPGLSDIQIRWQGAALKVLLTQTDQMVYKPWIPAWLAVSEIRAEAGCSAQAASGALRALLTAGLAARSETDKGLFWRPTDAAVRSQVLLLHEFNYELSAISTTIESIDGKLDQTLWMQEVQQKLDAARLTKDAA